MIYNLEHKPIFPKKHEEYIKKASEEYMEKAMEKSRKEFEEYLKQRRIEVHKSPKFKVKGRNGIFVCLDKFYYDYFKKNYLHCILEKDIDDYFKGDYTYDGIIYDICEDDVIPLNNTQQSIFDLL